jgi:diadenylate cyclase
VFEFFSRHFLSLDFRWVDFIDIAIVYYIFYKVLLLIKGTRAIQMVKGLVLIGVIYISSLALGLFTVHQILNRFFSYLFIIIIIVFQDDIRRVLARVGKTPFFSGSSPYREKEVLIEELVKTCVNLSRRRIGALIVLEKNNKLHDSIEIGIKLDSEVRAELLISIFMNSSPIHDGAIIVKDNRVSAAGCFLPLSKNPNIEKTLGTRHRAAIGITEVTDSIVLVVSEERKEISFVKEGEIIRNVDGPKLRKILKNALSVEGDENE